jgi:hypothetical protein
MNDRHRCVKDGMLEEEFVVLNLIYEYIEVHKRRKIGHSLPNDTKRLIALSQNCNLQTRQPTI